MMQIFFYYKIKKLNYYLKNIKYLNLNLFTNI